MSNTDDVLTKEKYDRGDSLHNPKVNLTGYVLSDNGDAVAVRTARGEFSWAKNGLQFIPVYD